MKQFQGKTALVTGGTSGIGRVTALALADAGANVVITGRRAPEGEKVAQEIASRGVKSRFVRGDITDESHVKAAVDAAATIGNGLNFAFNNAGIEVTGPITEATVEQYRTCFDINVLGVLLSLKHEIPALLKSGGGSIVNNASIAGRIGMPGAGVYIASKHAVIGLTKTAAMEVAKQNIRVNSVSPAAIETDMFDRFTGNRNPDAVGYMTSLHPIGRTGRPNEIASPVLFLFSDAASFITGHDLLVDGGLCVP
ncbi:MAG: glucose 1-dehydrogenase [Planctomycetes bacterium]|nr:glucose 1-dehydrogenase [Planctomycetota bacterium]